ncbi:hypothetical protein ANTRET_LOCUS2930 [Anthophora retusa]
MRTIVLLAFVAAFAFLERADALASDTTTTVSTKEVKEPKEIKQAATASKDVKDAIKAAKEAKKHKEECLRDCLDSYDPICAHDPNDTSVKPRTFGSLCALDTFNCEMGTKLVTKSKGECPGAGGVRIS